MNFQRKRTAKVIKSRLSQSMKIKLIFKILSTTSTLILRSNLRSTQIQGQGQVQDQG